MLLPGAKRRKAEALLQHLQGGLGVGHGEALRAGDAESNPLQQSLRFVMSTYVDLRTQRRERLQQRRERGRSARQHADDVRGLARAVVTATTNVTGVVHEMHKAIGAFPVITDLVYRSVQGVTGLVGSGLEAALEALSPLLGASAPGFEREAFVAALNGVVGDHLAATHNPLAITMSLQPPLDAPADDDVLLLLVHGSSNCDLQWTRLGHDHGEALAVELGVVPVYAHYNSGLHISDNGAQLAALLEQHASAYRAIVVVAHSMGGLVARAALEAGTQAQHQWRRAVKALVTLGSPHQGAPLERGGNVVETLLGVTPWTAPLQTLARLRSAGITDLRYGTVVAQDGKDVDRFAPGTDRRTPLPLPTDVRCYAVAATTSPADAKNPAGDGLVPVASALGEHDDERQRLRFNDTHIVYDTHHLGLLSSRAVYTQLELWLRDISVNT
jgi:pimeloyl-ACP methyl ester carboxylesterase